MPNDGSTSDDKIVDLPIHLRGDPKKFGAVVARRTPAVFRGPDAPAFSDKMSGREQLARWLVDIENERRASGTSVLATAAGQPGLTGLWQVSGRSDLSFDELVRLDFFYIETWSIWLDLVILVRTIPAVLFKRGAY